MDWDTDEQTRAGGTGSSQNQDIRFFVSGFTFCA